jgi:hypothetical protein
MDQFYLFLSSGDSKNLHPANNASDFTVQLPRIISLEGQWECGLTEIDVNGGLPEPLYLCTDACIESYVKNTSLPLLRVVVAEDYTVYQVPYYMRVSGDNLHSIRIYLKNQDLQEIKSSPGEIWCVLHFRRVRQV